MRKPLFIHAHIRFLLPSTDTIDFIGESTDVTYFPTIAEVIICENITIINDDSAESFEEFGVTLSSDDPAVTFLVSQGTVIIVDDDGQ